jgi:hypothetical protein
MFLYYISIYILLEQKLQPVSRDAWLYNKNLSKVIFPETRALTKCKHTNLFVYLQLIGAEHL